MRAAAGQLMNLRVVGGGRRTGNERETSRVFRNILHSPGKASKKEEFRNVEFPQTSETGQFLPNLQSLAFRG